MRVLPGVVVAAAMFGLGCMTTSGTNTLPLEASRAIPAAEGTAIAAAAPNGNTELHLKVKHVAPASRIVDGAAVYVVWVQPQNGRPQNVGVLSINMDLEGSLNTLTPLKRFRVLVTPEANGEVQQPHNEEVMTTGILGK